MSFAYSKWAFTLEDFIWTFIVELFNFLRLLFWYNNNSGFLYVVFSEM